MNKKRTLDYILVILILAEISIFLFMVYNGFSLNLPDESNDDLENSIITDDKSLTGKVISIESKGSKMTIYSIFLLIVAVAIFFIAKERNKEDIETKKIKK